MTDHDFYDRIKGIFQKKAESDKRIQSILKRIESGKATFADTAEYSQLVSELLGSTLSEHLGAETTAYVKEYVCREMLRDQYESMNDLLASVQRALNEKVGLRVAPQRAAFPTERVNVIAHALEDPTVPIDVIKRRAKSPVANVSKSFHDDYIKENAGFRSRAGLKCFIVRTTDGKCCKWCTAMAGRYEYGSEPHDVYRRHDNCGCTVIYESGRQRQDVWTKKTWEVPEGAKKKYEPVRLSPERAKTLQQAKLSQYRGLTSGGGSGIIQIKGVADVEQAKKRTHKIYITDTAISKVGTVKISDFTGDQIVNMQQKHKELLKLAKEKNDSNEVLFIDDLFFSSEVQILGSEFAVSPGKNPFAVSVILNAEPQSLVYLHNHPSTNNFSVGDIDTFVCEKAIKAMSVVTNQGEVYVLNKNGNYSFVKTRELLKELYDSFPGGEIEDREFVSAFLKRCKEGGIEYAKSK